LEETRYWEVVAAMRRFNVFKDEFTDFKKFKRKGKGMGLRAKIQKGAFG
jgi:hypothetical protein